MPRAQTKTFTLHRIESPVARLLATVATALSRRRDRAMLARLDAHLLRDIGLDDDSAAQEAAKPFWQA
jgi:uncharacterized protein YjiS (DUF1127 family)